MTTRRTAALLAAASLFGAACGGSSDSSGAAFNKADVKFAQGMIPHHEQAIEMADMALDPTSGASAAVVQLATQVKGAQDPEVATMKTLLTTWGQPLEVDMSDGHAMESMEGMMSADEMTALDGQTGAAFDSQWAKMMIEHHQGAIAMAKAAQADGKSADIKQLAGAIVTAQQAEITTLQPIAG